MRLLFASLIALAFVSSGFAADSPSPNGITVQGTGWVDLTPKCVRVTINVSTKEAKATESMTANSKTMTKLFGILESEHKLAKTDMRTATFTISPSYRYDKNADKNVFQGYVTDNSLIVMCRDTTTVGSIIDSMISNGATSVSDVAFMEDEAKDATLKALKLAMQNARDKADTLAATGGIEIGSPLAITEEIRFNRQLPYNARGDGTTAAGSQSTPLAPGRQRVFATVTVRYWVNRPATSK